MTTFYLDRLPDEGDLARIEEAVQAEGHRVELAEVLHTTPAINVHGYTYRCERSLRYWLNVAGCSVLDWRPL